MKLPTRWQPYVFAAMAVLALALSAGYDLYRERATSVASAKADTANLARLLDAHTDQTLRRVDGVLLAAAELLRQTAAAGGAGPRPTPEALQAMLPADGLVSALVWLAPDGQVLASTLGASGEAAAAPLLQDWQARHRAKPEARITVGRLQALGDQVRHMPMGRALHPLPASTGAPPGAAQTGALVALVDLSSLRPVLDALDTGTNGFVTLFLDDGWMLATAPHKPALFERNWFNTPMFQEHLPRNRVGTVQQVVVRDGTERVYSYRALADFPLVVSTGVSMTDALAPWRSRIAWNSLLLALVGGALLLAAHGMARSTARRMATERAAANEARLAQQAITAARDEAQRSAHFLSAITDNLPMRIAYIGHDRRYRFVNRAQAERLGLAREAILGRSRAELNQPPLPDSVQQAVAGALAGQEERVVADDLVDGASRTMDAVLIPDIGDDGRVQGFYMAATDVTDLLAQQRELSRALAERETLLREVYHRVKNNLQVVQSLLNLQRRGLPSGTARAALDDSIRRIQAMALVHEKLYQTGNLEAVALPDYTQDLLRHLGDASDAQQRQITLQARIDPVHAGLEQAVPYGLLVAELVSNGLKHAFPAGQAGTIEVSLVREAGGARLTVRDQGVGLPAGFAVDQLRESMGLQLAISLALQLGGELQAEDAQGAVFSALLTRLA